MVTIAYLGDLGSGKTTKCTRDIILTKLMHPNKKMFLNYHLYNYDYTVLDMMELYLNHPDERDLIIGIDEIYTTMDCRISSSYRNRIESYFMAMTRKAKADLFITMQYETFVDCRLSPFIKVKYIMEAIPIKKTVVINGIEYSYNVNHPNIFKCTLIDERNSNNPIIKEFHFDGLRWFTEFNTDEYIKPPEDVLRTMEIKQMKDKITYAKLTEQLKNGVIDGRKKPKAKKED